MKLNVSSYNNGASTWTEAEETAILSYTFSQHFNEPAELTVVLADPAGTIAQKYNTDANDVFVGAGKVVLEDPTGTDIFTGRILRARANTNSRTVELYCQDWLSQLDEEQIIYDMREDLDGAGLRQSNLKTDPDSAVAVSPVYSAYTAIGGAVQDNGGVFTDDTTDANDVGADDVRPYPAGPAVNDGFLFGFDNTVSGVRVNVSTAGVNYTGVTIVWYYSTGAGAWTVLTVTDGTNLFRTAGSNNITWTPPSDWATATYALLTKFWIKAKLTAFTSWDTAPLIQQCWTITQNVFDDDMTWDADEFNQKYLMLDGSMAGKITVSTGPYLATAANVDIGDGDPEAVWEDDTSVATFFANNNYTMQYDFKVIVGHNTPTDLYSHDSLTAIRVLCTYQFDGGGIGAICDLEVYDNTAAAWVKLQTLIDDATTKYRTTVSPPGYLLTRIIDSSGIAKVRFNVTDAAWGANATVVLYYIAVEASVTTSAYSSATLITDTVATNRLFVVTDFEDTAAQKLWEGVPYCIAKQIYKHIDSAESGTIITGGDVMETLTCAATIEHTSGLSTRQYKDQTRLSILQDLARQDKAEFWISPGTTTVTYKSTWNDAVADETLTDTDVLSWTMAQDYQTLVNKCTVYGMRIGDEQLSSSYSDATSIAKFVNTRTRVSRDAGLVTEYDCLARATALVNQYNSVQKIISATLRGNTLYATHANPISIGEEIQITSTYLGLTDAWYVVQGLEYDSKSDITTLHMHPRVSATGLQREEMTSVESAMQSMRRGGAADKYVPPPETNIV